MKKTGNSFLYFFSFRLTEVFVHDINVAVANMLLLQLSNWFCIVCQYRIKMRCRLNAA